MRTILLLLSGGKGTRFGADLPKQFLPLAGQPILLRTLHTFERHPAIDEICIVSNPDYIEATQKLCPPSQHPKLRHIIAGGAQRYDSTLNGLRLYANQDVHILIHDAVRPLVSPTIISNVCAALQEHPCVNLCIPSADTILTRRGDFVEHTLQRSLLARVQTPQGFHADTLRQAYEQALSDPHFVATDDCGVVERYLPHTPIYIVEGEESNQKLTYPDDMPLLEHLWRKQQADIPLPENLSPHYFLERYRQRQLRPLQLKMLEMLKIIARILEQHQIGYWMEGGTLLGALRHGGFIPWDDDMDIDIMAADAPRLCEALDRHLPPTMVLERPTAKTPIYKVRCLNSFFVEYADDFTTSYPKGVYIDIFLKEDAPTVSRRFAKKVARGYARSNSILHQQHYYSWRSMAELFYFGAKRALCKTLWTIAQTLRPKGKYVAMQLQTNGCGLLHEKEHLFPLRKIRFEDTEFYAPADPEHFLRESFGDWKQLPPEDQRQAHAIYYAPHLD